MQPERLESIKRGFASQDGYEFEAAWEQLKSVVEGSDVPFESVLSIELLTVILASLNPSEENEVLEEKLDIVNAYLEVFITLLIFLSPTVYFAWFQKITKYVRNLIKDKQVSSYTLNRIIDLRSFFLLSNLGLDEDDEPSSLPLDDLRSRLAKSFIKKGKTKIDAARYLIQEALKEESIDIYLIVTLIELLTTNNGLNYDFSHAKSLIALIQEVGAEVLRAKLKQYTEDDFSSLTLKRKVYLLWFLYQLGIPVRQLLIKTIRQINTWPEEEDQEIKVAEADSLQEDLLYPLLLEMLTPDLLEMVQEEGTVYSPFVMVMQTTTLVDYLVRKKVLPKVDFYAEIKLEQLEKTPADFAEFATHPLFLKQLYRYCISMEQSKKKKRELGFSMVFTHENQVAFSLPILNEYNSVSHDDWSEGLLEQSIWGRQIAGHFHPPKSSPLPSFAYSAEDNDFIGDISAFVQAKDVISEELIVSYDEKKGLVYVGSFKVGETFLGCALVEDEEDEDTYIYTGERSPRSIVYEYDERTNASSLEAFSKVIPEMAHNLTQMGLQTTYYVYQLDKDGHTAKLLEKHVGTTSQT